MSAVVSHDDAIAIRYREQVRRQNAAGGHPITARLDAWQTHCEVDHGATALDYRRRVLEWHRENHPDCTFAPDVPRAELREERVARKFHEVYEEAAPAFGYETRAESAAPWAEVPEENRRLMVHVVTTLVARGVISIP